MRYLRALQMHIVFTALDELFFRKKLTIIHLPTEKFERKENKKGQGSKKVQDKRKSRG